MLGVVQKLTSLRASQANDVDEEPHGYGHLVPVAPMLHCLSLVCWGCGQKDRRDVLYGPPFRLHLRSSWTGYR